MTGTHICSHHQGFRIECTGEEPRAAWLRVSTQRCWCLGQHRGCRGAGGGAGAPLPPHSPAPPALWPQLLLLYVPSTRCCSLVSSQLEPREALWEQGGEGQSKAALVWGLLGRDGAFQWAPLQVSRCQMASVLGPCSAERCPRRLTPRFSKGLWKSHRKCLRPSSLVQESPAGGQVAVPVVEVPYTSAYGCQAVPRGWLLGPVCQRRGSVSGVAFPGGQRGSSSGLVHAFPLQHSAGPGQCSLSESSAAAPADSGCPGGGRSTVGLLCEAVPSSRGAAAFCPSRLLSGKGHVCLCC